MAVGCGDLGEPFNGVCQVTIPNGSAPPGEVPSPQHHGNGKLWTVLPADGKLLVQLGPDGRYGEKFPWWRGAGVQGKLSITGRRLDGPAPPLESSIPAGYGETGFQASSIIFPSEGCWETTGKAGDAALTFVLEVRFKR
jgi:hypothetical protein